MSKCLEINVEMGLCTNEMAKENPVKDFEILIEEYKDKWSKQMYDYFKECLNEIKKKLKRLEYLEKSYKQAIDMKCAMERIINRDSKKLKALKIIEESGCSLEHILLIEKTKNYDEYDAQFDKYLEIKYEPFKFELRKSKEEYDLVRKALLNSEDFE